MTEKEITRISKFLSLVLRHKPETIGIALDENGWTDVGILLDKARQAGVALTPGILRLVVDTNAKKRFAFDETGARIRASQGHSVEIDLGYKALTPPDILYHGTAEKWLHSILETGLDKRRRHHVHLSADVETALNVGQRHGKPIVLSVLAGNMHAEGFAFFRSENGVWLTDRVPPAFILSPVVEK
jgi:putative RNA 2'-phosphotransferase